MVFRQRIISNGRRTNRINCPKSLAERNIKVVSFDECRDCEFAFAIREAGVDCLYPKTLKSIEETLNKGRNWEWEAHV